MKIVCFNIFFIFIFFNTSIGKNLVREETSDSLKKRVLKSIQFKSYENNSLGYTSDSDDKPFVDLTLSIKSHFYSFDYLMKVFPKQFWQDLHLNFAFTGRFANYIGTRHSSPVIVKRLNPYLFFQYTPKHKNVTFELGYGHESNGQAIDDSTTFFKTAALQNNNINETIDHVSRGWDYVGTSLIFDFFANKNKNMSYETNVSLKYYLNKGILEGTKEEYYRWEKAWSGSNYTRNDVSGISTTITCYIDSFFINRIEFGYETGIARPFFNNSIKLMVGFKIINFRFALTYRYGYNGDLAQFGKLNSSYGVSIVIPPFKNISLKDR